MSKATLAQLSYIIDHWREEFVPVSTVPALTWSDVKARPNGAAHVVKASRRCKRMLAESEARPPMDTLTAIVTMYHRRLVRIARNNEDIVQDAYVWLAAHPPKTVEDGLNQAVSVIKHILVDAHRHDVIVNRVLPLLAMDEPRADHTASILAIRRMVSRLPRQYAEVLTRYLDGERIERSEKDRLHRARQSFKAMLTA